MFFRVFYRSGSAGEALTDDFILFVGSVPLDDLRYHAKSAIVSEGEKFDRCLTEFLQGFFRGGI